MSTYNPSKHLPLSKALGSTGKFPLNAKYKYYTDGENGIYAYRAFVDIDEVNAYFPTIFRDLGQTVLVNDGGTLSVDGGSIEGGTNTEYWYADGVGDEDLIAKGSGGGAVSSVSSANTDIAVATGTTTPVLTLNSGLSANQIVKRGSSGRIPIGSTTEYLLPILNYIEYYANTGHTFKYGSTVIADFNSNGLLVTTGNMKILNSTGRIGALGMASGATAPTQVGTIKMVVTDDNGNFSFANIPSGGGSAWGSITGTLSSQTDLQTALNAKQDTLVSATNIKTINGSSILGSGDLTVGGGGGSGTVNSGTANRLAYYASTGTAVSQLTAITANRVLLSDANGLPVASSVTNTTLGYLDATSSIQTQLDNRLPLSGGTLTGDLTGTSITLSGTITATGGGGTSDIRFKKIVQFDLDLTWLDEDRTISFKWDENKIEADKRLHWGYSAQEIQEWAADLIIDDNPDHLFLNQVELLVLENKRLKQRMTEKDREVEEMKKRLDRIETLLGETS